MCMRIDLKTSSSSGALTYLRHYRNGRFHSNNGNNRVALYRIAPSYIHIYTHHHIFSLGVSFSSFNEWSLANWGVRLSHTICISLCNVHQLKILFEAVNCRYVLNRWLATVFSARRFRFFTRALSPLDVMIQWTLFLLFSFHQKNEKMHENKENNNANIYYVSQKWAPFNPNLSFN